MTTKDNTSHDVEDTLADEVEVETSVTAPGAIERHPAGLTALGVTVLVWAATQLGVEIPADVAAALVRPVAAGVTYFTPR